MWHLLLDISVWHILNKTLDFTRQTYLSSSPSYTSKHHQPPTAQISEIWNPSHFFTFLFSPSGHPTSTTSISIWNIVIIITEYSLPSPPLCRIYSPFTSLILDLVRWLALTIGMLATVPRAETLTVFEKKCGLVLTSCWLSICYLSVQVHPLLPDL